MSKNPELWWWVPLMAGMAVGWFMRAVFFPAKSKREDNRWRQGREGEVRMVGCLRSDGRCVSPAGCILLDKCVLVATKRATPPPPPVLKPAPMVKRYLLEYFNGGAKSFLLVDTLAELDAWRFQNPDFAPGVLYNHDGCLINEHALRAAEEEGGR